MTIGVLQSLARERSSASGGAHDETASHLVTGGPHRVASALESEHRIEDVDGNQRLAVSRVRGADSSERCKRASFVDSDVNDLTLRALFVGQQLFAVYRGVVLPCRVVDLGAGEVRVHTEGACLIRDDRNDAVAD